MYIQTHVRQAAAYVSVRPGYQPCWQQFCGGERPRARSLFCATARVLSGTADLQRWRRGAREPSGSRWLFRSARTWGRVFAVRCTPEISVGPPKTNTYAHTFHNVLQACVSVCVRVCVLSRALPLLSPCATCVRTQAPVGTSVLLRTHVRLYASVRNCCPPLLRPRPFGLERSRPLRTCVVDCAKPRARGDQPGAPPSLALMEDQLRRARRSPAWSDVLVVMDQLHRRQGGYPEREELEILVARDLWDQWLQPRRDDPSRNRVCSCVMHWCLNSAQPSPHIPSLPSLPEALVFATGSHTAKLSPCAAYTLCQFRYPALIGWKWVTRTRGPFVRRAAAAMERGRLLPASVRIPAVCELIAEYFGTMWPLVMAYPELGGF